VVTTTLQRKDTVDDTVDAAQGWGVVQVAVLADVLGGDKKPRKIPPDLLRDGERYYLKITAFDEPGRDCDAFRPNARGEEGGHALARSRRR